MFAGIDFVGGSELDRRFALIRTGIGVLQFNCFTTEMGHALIVIPLFGDRLLYDSRVSRVNLQKVVSKAYFKIVGHIESNACERIEALIDPRLPGEKRHALSFLVFAKAFDGLD